MRAIDKQVGGDHYKQLKDVEPWVLISKYNIDFYRGNFLKYMLRDKGNSVENFNKAMHCLERWRETPLNRKTMHPVDRDVVTRICEVAAQRHPYISHEMIVEIVTQHLIFEPRRYALETPRPNRYFAPIVGLLTLVIFSIINHDHNTIANPLWWVISIPSVLLISVFFDRISK